MWLEIAMPLPDERVAAMSGLSEVVGFVHREIWPMHVVV